MSTPKKTPARFIDLIEPESRRPARCVYCSTCGSTNVRTLTWFNPNTSATDGPPDEERCMTCHDEPREGLIYGDEAMRQTLIASLGCAECGAISDCDHDTSATEGQS